MELKTIAVSFLAAFAALFWVCLFLGLPQPFPELAVLFLGPLIVVTIAFTVIAAVVLTLKVVTDWLLWLASLLGYQRDI